MADRTFKEELTTKMHSEFAVSEDTATRHRVFSAIRSMRNGYSVSDVTSLYGVTEKDIAKYSTQYNELLP